jgi:DNA repair ATPase RecN
MLFMIIIVTSAFAVIRNSSVRQEVEKMMTNYKDVRAQLLRYEKKTYEVYDLLEELKPEIEELYDIAAGGGEKTSIWFDPDDLEKHLNEEQIKQRRMLPDEVFMLQIMQRDIMCATIQSRQSRISLMSGAR